MRSEIAKYFLIVWTNFVTFLHTFDQIRHVVFTDELELYRADLPKEIIFCPCLPLIFENFKQFSVQISKSFFDYRHIFAFSFLDIHHGN